MLEKLSKMSAREAMITLVGRPPMYGEQARWLHEIAKKLGISFRTARSIWLGEISKEDHIAIKVLKERATIEVARREVRQLASQYTAILGGMSETNKDFFGSEIDRLERLVRVIGGLDSA